LKSPRILTEKDREVLPGELSVFRFEELIEPKHTEKKERSSFALETIGVQGGRKDDLSLEE